LKPSAIESLLSLWPEVEGGRAELINLSENHTFRIDGPDGRRHALRLHRPGYQSDAAIDSELAWLAALRVDTALRVPQPLRGTDGKFVQCVDVGDGLAPRAAVLFAWEKGREPVVADNLGQLFATLGAQAAQLHEQAIGFVPPPGFTRPTWDAGAVLDADGPWGNWRQAPHVDARLRTTLDALDERLRADLAAYGQDRGRFGLIHADMRLANLLVDGSEVTLLDFDDCGFGWFAYDFAAAISFFEDAPEVPELKRCWLDAYQAIRPLEPEDIAAMDTLVLLRRMALLAWIGSHGETALAQSHVDRFAAGTAVLAERYLGQ
jgi:Ser/Thr protein kinase RdoA (MazF antagonist)